MEITRENFEIKVAEYFKSCEKVDLELLSDFVEHFTENQVVKFFYFLINNFKKFMPPYSEIINKWEHYNYFKSDNSNKYYSSNWVENDFAGKSKSEIEKIYFAIREKQKTKKLNTKEIDFVHHFDYLFWGVEKNYDNYSQKRFNNLISIDNILEV